MNRAFTNILASDVATSAAFYETLLGMKQHFTSDWFVILTHPDMEGFELGILDRAAEIVPDTARGAPGGVMLTFVVDDCDAIHERAIGSSAAIVEPPTDMAYGQRRMLLRDPNGTLVDISAPTAPMP